MHNSDPALSHNESRWFVWYKTAGNQKKKGKKKKTVSEIHLVGAELGLGFENLFDLGILMVEDGIIVADGSTRRSGIDSATSTLRELTSTTATATTTTTTTRASAAAVHVVAAMCDPPQPTTATKQRTNPTTAWRSPVLNGIFVANKNTNQMVSCKVNGVLKVTFTFLSDAFCLNAHLFLVSLIW